MPGHVRTPRIRIATERRCPGESTFDDDDDDDNVFGKPIIRNFELAGDDDHDEEDGYEEGEDAQDR